LATKTQRTVRSGPTERYPTDETAWFGSIFANAPGGPVWFVEPWARTIPALNSSQFETQIQPKTPVSDPRKKREARNERQWIGRAPPPPDVVLTSAAAGAFPWTPRNLPKWPLSPPPSPTRSSSAPRSSAGERPPSPSVSPRPSLSRAGDVIATSHGTCREDGP